MPQYFYHLKFELYPHPHPQLPSKPSAKPTSKAEAEELQREVWLPKSGNAQEEDIFNSASWPRHKPMVSTVLPTSTSKLNDLDYSRLDIGATGRSIPGAVIGVIDCGPSRALDQQTATDSNSIVRSSASASENFPPPSPGNIPRCLEVARRDWRFGRVRVESWDLDSGNTHEMEARKRGESSGHAASGMMAGGLTAAGRVAKARFEEGKNTELGWGVVHLYRDGENSGGGVEIYNSTAASVTVGEEGKEKEGERDEDFTTLCIPAVPSYLTPSDFLGFVGEKTREEVSHFRMVMTGRMNRYLVLMKFRDGGVARKWKSEWDGKVFNSMEPETCHVTFIKSITFQTPTSTSTTSFPELAHDPFTPYLKPFPPPTPNLVELPTCPVCLERMDDTTGLLTILCQHVFHCACLQKWRGSGCPVCRHTNPSPSISSSPDPPFGATTANLCSVCDSSSDLWICLICGLVGCGRYKGGHAKEHWKESAHNFALEIETQHVWDYAGDLWVHRLIRDKGNGKVVEFPSSSASRGNESVEEDGMEMVPRAKLERIGIEYTHLLTSQLESQRVYFEELVGKAVAKASAASSSASTAAEKAIEAVTRLSILESENRKLKEEIVVSLEKDLAREKRKAEKSSEVARGFGKSLMEEKKVSEGLMERIGHVNASMARISGELSVVKGENEELREENRDLLFSITAGERLKGMNDEEGGLVEGEVEGGSLVVPTPAPKVVGKGKGKGKK